MAPFLKEYKPGKHNAVEWIIIGLIAVLLFNILQTYMGVNVWRQDSMYYVSSYDDKLANEGRWINHLFFRYLQQVPASLAILLSYFSVIYFCFQVAFRVSGNTYMALAFGMLCGLIPVLPVQLEWPETLLIGFLLLAASPYFASTMPRFVFFPVMAVLFFGTFSAFFFVMPLLFLKNISFRKGAELIAIWIVSFVSAYFFTNLMVWMMTGDTIQIAGWRNPTPARDIDGLLENISRIAGSANIHFYWAASFLREEIIASLTLIGVVTAFVKKTVSESFNWNNLCSRSVCYGYSGGYICAKQDTISCIYRFSRGLFVERLSNKALCNNNNGYCFRSFSSYGCGQL